MNKIYTYLIHKHEIFLNSHPSKIGSVAVVEFGRKELRR